MSLPLLIGFFNYKEVGFMKLILLKSRNNINLLFDALKTAGEKNVTPLNIHIKYTY